MAYEGDYLDGGGLGTVWANMKNYVSTVLGDYETIAAATIAVDSLTAAIGNLKASLGSAAYQDISIFASAEDMGIAQNDITSLKSGLSTVQGYFTNGVAKSAAKLTTGQQTLFGNTYWTSGGVPTSVGYDASHTAALNYISTIDATGYIRINVSGNNFAGFRVITPTTGQYAYGSSNIGGVDSGGVYFGHTLSGYSDAEMRLKAGVGLTVGNNIIAGGGVAAGGIIELGTGTSSYVQQITAGTGLTGGTITSSGTIALAIATASTLGGIRIGSHLSIDGSTGVVSVTDIPTDSTVAGWGYIKAPTLGAVLDIGHVPPSTYSSLSPLADKSYAIDGASSMAVTLPTISDSKTHNIYIYVSNNYGSLSFSSTHTIRYTDSSSASLSPCSIHCFFNGFCWLIDIKKVKTSL